MPASLTHLQSRRRSSLARITKSKYAQVPTPARLTFYPNVTPTTYVSQEQEDAKLELAEPEFAPLFPAVLFPPSTAPSSGPKRKRQPPGKRRSQGYIPRPPNAFMLFRADFVKQRHVPGSVESNHGSLSKIIGSCWRSLPAKEKAHWDYLAKKEKIIHKEKYPDYKFCPVHKKRKKNKDDAAKLPKEEEDEDFEDSDGEYAESSSSLKRKAPSSTAKSTKAKSKPFAATTQTLTLDNSPPSVYPSASRRFAYATLREERQEFIIQCLVQGIKKKPVEPFLPSDQQSEGMWLEDHVQRWDLEKSYAAVREEAEREEKEAKESFPPKRVAKPQTTHQEKSIIGHRRSSSVPLPDEFVHHHSFAHGYSNGYGYGFVGHQQNQYYYPQPQVNGWDYSQFQGSSDGTPYGTDGYSPFTNSNWGTDYPALPGPLPSSSSSPSDPAILLPQIPSAMASSFPDSISGSMPPSPTPSPLTASDAGMNIAFGASMSARPSFSQYLNLAGTSTGQRNSISGRNLLFGRRASSAQPCLLSQYNSGAFAGFDASVWGQQPPAHVEQQVTPEQEMAELEFDPSAVQGWNPNFSFGSPANSTSTKSNTQPPSPPLLCQSPLDTDPSAYGFVQPPLNLDMSCTIPMYPLDPLDPGPSPISAVSAVSEVSPIAFQMHAPQPITPSRVQDFDVGHVEGAGAMTLDTNSVEPEIPVAPVVVNVHGDNMPQSNTDDAEKVDSAKVFNDLWKNLASSQSFCMGTLGFPNQRDSVAMCSAEIPPHHQMIDADENDEEEDGEFEKALRREHSELLAVGGC